jgi:hypothetical protein
MNIHDCFQRRLRFYFNHWKVQKVDHHAKVMKQGKVFIIRSYRAYLMNYFNRWREQRSKKNRKKRIMVIEDEEQKKDDINFDINETTERIKQSEVRSYQKGKKQYKKVLEKLYLLNVQLRFKQWAAQVKYFNKKQSVTEKVVVKKIKRRLLRQAFDRYLKKSKQIRKETNDDDKQKFVSETVRYNAMKRMFKNIRLFSKNHKMAKKFLKLTMKRFDHN